MKVRNKKQSSWGRLPLIVLVCALIVSLGSAVLAAVKDVTVTMPAGRVLISQTNYPITKGVTETQVIMNNADGTSQVCGSMATIAPNAAVKLKASYSGYYTEGSTVESRKEAAKNLEYDMKTTTAQAAAYEAATGETVVVATNADYYNMQTGQCTGYLIMEGNFVQSDRGEILEPYFAVLKDGSYEIRDYGTPHDDVVEAISGPFYLVKDGNVVPSNSDNTLSPRNSIGIKEDGTLVTFVADGRQGVSSGMTVYEMALMLKAQGCVDALYLDGGGSATFASRREGSDKLTVQNTPSDGPERVVASSLLIVSTAEQTGKFDHAALDPNNEMYIAGSTVQFTANGVDAGGYPADIPADAKWALADSSYGTLDQNGLFQSSGKCGTVTVNLTQGTKVLGSTTIEVQEPDEIFFQAEALNLAFNASSDLGLTAKYQNRVMTLGGHQFTWTINPTTPGKKPEDIGSFNGNVFTTVKAKETLNATIDVSYTKADGAVLKDTIAVEIGRMPQVFLDFEPDANGQLIECAEHDWGINGNTYTPRTSPLTFTGWDDSVGGLTQKTESGPFAFDGSYIANSQDATYHSSSHIFGADGYTFATWHTGFMQEHSSIAKVVSNEDGEARFGDYSLSLKYDYTNLNPGYRNVNTYLHYTGEDIYFEGAPSGLGVWVYAPEGTPNYWIWTTISYYDEASGDYQWAYVHFYTQEGRGIQYNGIYWNGWMYCEADLTPYAKYASPEHPLKIATGQAMMLLTFIPGGSANENGDKIPMGDFKAGSLYFDNFRIVYGDTIDDLENPIIDKVTVNGKETSANAPLELDSGKLDITAAFHDPEGDNATGIKTDKTSIWVDGIKQTLTASGETEAKAAIEVPNGSHSITVTISDGFGNVVTDTRYVTVNDKTSAFGTVAVTGKDVAEIGTEYQLKLTTDSEKVSSVTAEIKLKDTFGIPNVTFDDGYNGTSSYEKNVLRISAESDAPKSGTVATITFKVSPALAKGDLFDYTVEKGSFTASGTDTALTFAQEKATVGVTAPYELSADIMMTGGSGKIYVTTADGKAAGKVEVYAYVENGDDELIGKTNRSGELVTNRFCQNAGETFTIYAKGEKGLSFRYSNVTNGLSSDDVTPTNVRLNAVAKPSTTQSITWFSTPQYTEDKAVVEFVTKDKYDSGKYEFQTATGTSKAYAFNGGTDDNNASLINTVVLEGLKSGTTYCYRVGDGIEGHWSDIRQFTTAVKGADTSFFVMGDTQLQGDAAVDAEAIEMMHQIANNIHNEGVDFGIQTGDYIDVANSLSAWNEIQGIFSEDYPNTSVIQVLGNHEYYGDTSGKLSNAIFNTPDKDWYSVEYGNVYVAVINCNADLNKASEWLIKDAQESDCQWKVLTLHQPPYYTNPKGSSAAYNKIIPSAAEEAGIDLVFSGHDHAYARTEPIKAGAVDEENGVVYIISGDLGEKSRSSEYAAVNNPDFHFAKINQKYKALYLIVNATEKTLDVTAYNVDGSVVDSYQKEKLSDCDVNGHDYVYSRSLNKVTCSVCGDQPKDYTGWAKDKVSGKSMYFLNGKYKTGWFTIGTDIFHFGSNGLQHKTTVVEDIPTDCEKQGHKTVKCECGETKTVEYGNPTGHHFVEKTDKDGKTYYECEYCHKISDTSFPFIDVAEDAWYREAVEFTYSNDIIQGMTAIHFGPETKVTRAMLVTMIHRMEGKPKTEDTPKKFDDVKAGTWYTDAVNWASANGIVNGVSETEFAPTRLISRQETTAIFYRYATYKGYDVKASENLSKFKDASTIEKYAVEPMKWAVGIGLIQGMTPDTIEPRGTTIRAQVATIIMRFVQKFEDKATESDVMEDEAIENASSEAPEVPEETISEDIMTEALN